MIRLMKIEIKKLSKSLAFKIIAGLIILTVVMNLGIYGMVKIIDMPEVNAALEMSGLTLSGNMMFRSLIASPSGDVMLFSVILLCILIGSDFSSKTLQGQITAGYSRMTVAVSRLFTGIIIFTFFTVVYVGANTIGMSIIFGFGEKFTAAVAGDMLGRFVVHLISSIALISIYWLIIMSVKSIGASIGICLPTLMVGVILLQTLSGLFKVAKKIIDWTPYGIASIPAETLDASKIVRLLVVSVLTLVITIGINKITFDKAELK